jgi:hypothetical protein
VVRTSPGPLAEEAAGGPHLRREPPGGVLLDDDADFVGRCRFSFETTTAGAATTAGGLALVTTGIVLLVVDAWRNHAR